MANSNPFFKRMVEIRNVFYAALDLKFAESEAVNAGIRKLLRQTDGVIRLMERELDIDVEALNFEKANRRNIGQGGADASGWIPVTVALPEDDRIVAVTAVTKKGVRSWNRAFYDGATWHGSGSMAGVVAWMEIEPWEGEVMNG